MSLMTVPTSRHGDSLPAELRVSNAFRGSTYFPRARMAMGQRGLTQPPTNLSGLRGLWGLGQDDSGDDGGDDSGNGGDTGITMNCAGPCPQNYVMDPDTCICSPLPVVTTPTPVTPPSGYTGGCPGSCTGGTFMDQSSCTCVGTSPINTLSGGASIPGYTSAVPGYSGPTTYPPTGAPPSPPAGYEWATMVNASGSAIAKILTVAQGGSAVTLPNGNQLLYGSAASSVAGSLGTSFSGAAPLILIGGAIFLFMMMRK